MRYFHHYHVSTFLLTIYLAKYETFRNFIVLNRATGILFSIKLNKTAVQSAQNILTQLLCKGDPKKKRAPALIRPRFLVFGPNEMKL